VRRRSYRDECVNPGNINTPEYWNRVYREEWESGKARSASYVRNYAPIHEAILRLVPDGSRVLDVACGPGILCRKIKQRHPSAQVTGVDFSPYMITQNQALDAALGIDYRSMDIRTDLPAIGQTFDVVTMCEILEHLDDPEAVVAGVFTLLRTGGTFILTCPHDDCIPDAEHVRSWGHDALFHLLAPFGNTVSFVHFPPPYFDLWVLAYLTKTLNGGREERAP